MTLEDRIRDNFQQAGAKIRVPDRGELRTVPFRRPPRRPLLAFAAGVLGVGLLGLLLWLGAPGNEELPPELVTADSVELEWNRVEGIETDSDSVVFAHGPAFSLAVATSWSQESGTAVEGVYRTDNGVRWQQVNSEGPDGVNRVAVMVAHAEGFVVSGLHLDDGSDGSGGAVPQPALWSSADGVEWDLTPFPVPEPEDPADIVAYGVGPLAVDGTGGVALGEAVRLGPESEETPRSVSEDGTPQPQERRTFLWETDGSGEWVLADGAPQDPAALGAGPAGVVVVSSVSDGRAAWQRDGREWTQTAALSDSAPPVGMLTNQTGYLLVLEDGTMLFSRSRAARSTGSRLSS